MTFIKNNLLKIALILLIIVGAFFGYKKYTNKATTNVVFDPAKDKIYAPKLGPIKEQITLAGSIKSDKVAQLSFRNPGKMVWVGVKVGDRVRRGQGIASLDQAELRKNLQTQFNNYKSQLSQFNDVQFQYQPTKDKLLVTDTIQRILDRTQYSLDNSVINYEITDMAIKESVLTTPIDGIVTSISQPIAGTNINPATAIFTVIDPQSIYFESEIDQESVTSIKEGQATEVTLDSYTDKPINTSISYIAFTPVEGQSSTVYNVRFALPLSNNSLSYRLGMEGNAVITLSETNEALTVPIDSIYDDNGQKYVYVKNDKELVRKNVKIGIESDADTQILEGLTTNDQVVVKQI
jgi:RND family efflux transporter MFP subunit